VLLGALALLAATLAVIGVYGVTAFGVANRSREFGVRMALGADARRVLTGVLGGGLRQAAWGALAGAAAALAATRVLRGMLYDVSPTDPLTFATVLTLLLGAVLAGCLIPARRAARIDPMEALRHE
jgi:putative ABC transport system permease protein